jgi:hypothetical protein
MVAQVERADLLGVAFGEPEGVVGAKGHTEGCGVRGGQTAFGHGVVAVDPADLVASELGEPRASVVVEDQGLGYGVRVGTAISLMRPAASRRPIWLVLRSQNQTAPSGPVVIQPTAAPGVGTW